MIQRFAATSQRKALSHCQHRRKNMPPILTAKKANGRPSSGSPTRRGSDALSAHAEFLENLCVMRPEHRRRVVEAWPTMRKGESRERHTEIAVHAVAARMAMDNLAAREVRVSHCLAQGAYPRRRHMPRLQEALP